MESESFHTIFRNSFFSKKSSNPSYSIRAYAKYLGIRSSAVSEILRGVRNVSPRYADRVMERLQIPFDKRSQIVSNIKNNKDSGKKGTSSPFHRYHRIDMDSYHLISEWWHFAILSLIKTQGFKSGPESISSRLGITKTEASRAVRRLLTIGLVAQDSKGYLFRTKQKIETSDNIRNESLKFSHLKCLKLIERSLFEDSLELRDNCAITMAIDTKQLAKAKKITRQYMEKISKCLENNDANEVYKLSIHLFPLSGRKNAT